MTCRNYTCHTKGSCDVREITWFFNGGERKEKMDSNFKQRQTPGGVIFN